MYILWIGVNVHICAENRLVMIFFLSEHRGTGEGDVKWTKASGTYDIGGGLSYPQTEEPSGQVCAIYIIA